MKKIILLSAVFAFISLQAVLAQPKPDQPQQTAAPAVKNNGPVASYDRTVYDMGTIEQKVPKVATFVLSNTGNEPLMISTAQASCGCTGLQYDKEPILPGKSANISATYNAAVAGNFMKTITVRTNASDQPVVLQIKGTVEAKKE